MPQNLNTQSYAIIVAGGSGSRMQSSVPKQFLLIGSEPVLMHTIWSFSKSQYNPQIILVLPRDFHSYWQDLCGKYKFQIPHQIVNGGETRFHSVKNGLTLVAESSIVAIHDAVRPLTSVDIIDNAYNHANEHGNAVVAVKSRDSIRQLRNNKSTSLVRDEIYMVQTPQTFRSAQLKKAYEQDYNAKFTDDASVVEETGIAINLVEGDYKNIKITFPEDIAIAELLLRQ